MKRKILAAEPDPDNDELARLAEELDLTAVAPGVSGLLRRAEQAAMSYSAFTRELLGMELAARRERKLNRLLKRSRLGSVEGVEGFDFSARPRLEPRVVKELINCRFVEEHRNIICVGRPGLGKTRTAKALTHAACLRGYSVLFTTSADMLEDLHGSLADGTFKRVFRRYTKPAVLALDEFGYQPFDNTLANYLYRVVAARHQTGSVILTANTGFSKWSSFFPSEAQAVATVDRLLDCATILRFTGKSFRKPREIQGAPLEDDA